MVSGESVTLSCKATGSSPIIYQWNKSTIGEISSDRVNGVNTSTLTISSVTKQDEDVYYCVASNGGENGLLYKDRSHDAIVTVYGELVLYVQAVYNHWTGVDYWTPSKLKSSTPTAPWQCN